MVVIGGTQYIRYETDGRLLGGVRLLCIHKIRWLEALALRGVGIFQHITSIFLLSTKVDFVLKRFPLVRTCSLAKAPLLQLGRQKWVRQSHITT